MMDREALTEILGMPPPVPPGRGIKGTFDLVTLIVVLLGATYLGIAALGADLTSYLPCGGRFTV
jgi:hypothetical protein